MAQKNNQFQSLARLRDSAVQYCLQYLTETEIFFIYFLQVEFDGHKITERTVTLTVMSSADKVFMSLNKREVRAEGQFL